MHTAHTKIPAMQQGQINLVTDWTPSPMRVLLKKCCEVSWDIMIADCFLFCNLSVFLHFGCLGKGFACLALEPYCLCSNVPLVQIYLSLTLGEVILLHSLVFSLVPSQAVKCVKAQDKLTLWVQARTHQEESGTSFKNADPEAIYWYIALWWKLDCLHGKVCDIFCGTCHL